MSLLSKRKPARGFEEAFHVSLVSEGIFSNDFYEMGTLELHDSVVWESQHWLVLQSISNGGLTQVRAAARLAAS